MTIGQSIHFLCFLTGCLMVGVEGFEPSNNGVRVRCLTAWRHPSVFQCRVSHSFYIIPHSKTFVKPFFKKNKKIFHAAKNCCISSVEALLL